MKTVNSNHMRASVQVLALIAIVAAASGCDNSVIMGWDVSDNTLATDGGTDGGDGTDGDPVIDCPTIVEGQGPVVSVCWARNIVAVLPWELDNLSCEGVAEISPVSLPNGGFAFGGTVHCETNTIIGRGHPGELLIDNGEPRFIATTDPAGQVQWAKQLETHGYPRASLGFEDGSFIMGINLPPQNPDQIWSSDITRLSPNGETIWSTRVTGGHPPLMKTSDNGDILAYGRYRLDRATFGAGEANETTLECAAGAGNCHYYAQYSTDGKLISAENVTEEQMPNWAIPVDFLYPPATIPLADGGELVLANLTGAVTLGTGADEVVLAPRVFDCPFQNSSGEDLCDPEKYIAWYRPDGSLRWAGRIENRCAGFFIIADLKVLEDESILLTGMYSHTLEWKGKDGGTITMPYATLPDADGEHWDWFVDSFMVKICM